MSTTINIPLKDIHTDHEWNSRGDFAKTQVIELARDIEANTPKLPDNQGLLNPVTVRPLGVDKVRETGCKYALVAGFRRYFAFRTLGRETIPAFVQNLDDREATLLNISENIQRKDLNILQEAQSVAKLIALGMTQQEVAKRLNMSAFWVQVRMRLLQLEPEIQKEAAVGLISQKQITEIASLPTSTQRFDAVKKIKDAQFNNTRKSDLQIVRPKFDPTRKKVRTRPEIFEMIKVLGQHAGFGLYTRALSWSSGEITTAEFLRDVQEQYKKIGKDVNVNIIINDLANLKVA